MRQRPLRYALEVFAYPTKLILNVLQGIGRVGLVWGGPVLRRLRRLGVGPEMGQIEIKYFDAYYADAY